MAELAEPDHGGGASGAGPRTTCWPAHSSPEQTHAGAQAPGVGRPAASHTGTRRGAQHSSAPVEAQNAAATGGREGGSGEDWTSAGWASGEAESSGTVATRDCWSTPGATGGPSAAPQNGVDPLPAASRGSGKSPERPSTRPGVGGRKAACKRGVSVGAVPPTLVPPPTPPAPPAAPTSPPVGLPRPPGAPPTSPSPTSGAATAALVDGAAKRPAGCGERSSAPSWTLPAPPPVPARADAASARGPTAPGRSPSLAPPPPPPPPPAGRPGSGGAAANWRATAT